MSISTISPQQLHDMTQSGLSVNLIDVRTPAEFRAIHVSFARNVPLEQLAFATSSAERLDPSHPLYVICHSGARAKQACEKLMRAGQANVVTVDGGMRAWDAAGLPVVRGEAVMSLERQVRIAAGLLVVLGTALGYLVHPYLLGIPAFVGAGLVFAGVTDSCGMGMLLAKMPWNRVAVTTVPSNACSR